MSATAHTVEELKLVELDPSKQYVIYANPICVDIMNLAKAFVNGPSGSALDGAPIIAVRPLPGQSLDDAIAIQEKANG